MCVSLQGVPSRVPPNSSLLFEVEVLRVCKRYFQITNIPSFTSRHWLVVIVMITMITPMIVIVIIAMKVVMTIILIVMIIVIKTIIIT